MKSIKEYLDDPELLLYMDQSEEKRLEHFLELLNCSKNRPAKKVYKLSKGFIQKGVDPKIFLYHLRETAHHSSIEEIKRCAYDSKFLEGIESEEKREVDKVKELIAEYIDWIKNLNNENIRANQDFYYALGISIEFLIRYKLQPQRFPRYYLLELIDDVLLNDIFQVKQKRKKGRPTTPYYRNLFWIRRELEKINLKLNDIKSFIVVLLGKEEMPNYIDPDEPKQDYRASAADRIRRGTERYGSRKGLKDLGLEELLLYESHESASAFHHNEIIQNNKALSRELLKLRRGIHYLVSSYKRFQDLDEKIFWNWYCLEKIRGNLD